MSGSNKTRRPPRVELAREAYAEALAAARARSTPATWRRLVRAGENLRSALRDARALRFGARDVLVVDDDAALRETLKEVLEEEGLRVVTAEHGKAALDVLHRRRVLPRAIVLDLALPMMSGRELRRQLQRDPRLARIPVIVMSGADDGDGVSAARRLSKPFDPRELVDAVSRLAP